MGEGRLRQILVEKGVLEIKFREGFVTIWMFPKIGVGPKWMVKIMENPIKMDDLGVPLFLETSICFPNIREIKIFFNESYTVVFKDVNVVLFCEGLSLEIIFKSVLQRNPSDACPETIRMKEVELDIIHS